MRLRTPGATTHTRVLDEACPALDPVINLSSLSRFPAGVIPSCFASPLLPVYVWLPWLLLTSSLNRPSPLLPVSVFLPWPILTTSPRLPLPPLAASACSTSSSQAKTSPLPPFTQALEATTSRCRREEPSWWMNVYILFIATLICIASQQLSNISHNYAT